RALGGFAAGRERGNQDIVERGAVGDLLLEVLGTRPQRLVGQLFELGFERVDLGDARLVALDAALVGGAEYLAGERADHQNIILSGGRDTNLPDFDDTGTRSARSNRSCSAQRAPVPVMPRYALKCRTFSSFIRANGGLRPERPGFWTDRRGSHPCKLLSNGRSCSRSGKNRRVMRHCKRGAIARLPARPAAGGRARFKDCTMTSVTRSATPAPLSGPHRTRAVLAALALLVLPAGAGGSKDPSPAPADPHGAVRAPVHGPRRPATDPARA